MTDREPWMEDDAELSALIDDELDPERAARLRGRLADEPALARRLEELARVDESVRRAYAGIADEPVPERILALVGSRPDAGAAVHDRRRWSRTAALATAGLALAAGFALAFVVLPRTEPAGPFASVGERGAVDVRSPLHDALERAPSGESRSLADGWSATPRLTFASVDGSPCRRIDVAGPGGAMPALACRREGAWHVELVAFEAGGEAAEDVYRPAGTARSAIDHAIDGRIASEPMDREAERAWMARGWD
jgi:hypothetical protein